MRLQFERQQFQEDAAKAVVSLFAGVPKLADGFNELVYNSNDVDGFQLDETVVCNTDWQPFVSAEVIRERIRALQQQYHLPPFRESDFDFATTPGNTLNLTIEMETGVGKTYTYIKTIHELYEAYGWRKFVVVVPSIAIREGVKKSFEVTEEHFASEYKHPPLNFFIYNSQQLQDIYDFAQGNDIKVMIINVQAFNRKKSELLIFTSASDRFNGRAPIDVICQTRPIMIFDEPQSLGGKSAVESFSRFKPLFILRYSATHREIYNMIYRLDAIDAYNMHLVKKIAVKGVMLKGNLASSGYVYLEKVEPQESGNPLATVHFYKQKKDGTASNYKRKLEVQDDLFVLSNSLPVYHDGYVVKEIVWAGTQAEEAEASGDDAEAAALQAQSYIVFTNGLKLVAGEAAGNKDAEIMQRRLQIRETIATHFEREKQLFARGIKVLSLFFIDHVDKYRVYDDAVKGSSSGAAGAGAGSVAGSGPSGAGKEQAWHLGLYASIFEEEYQQQLEEVLSELKQPNLLEYNREYVHYLESIATERTHAGYFSRDGKRMVDSKSKTVSKKDTISEDVSAYDLIMKDKERLLDLNPERSPVRFIFSHSALREGWDNPNVFQICTLKDGGDSTVRKRQEVGRGMRLCVDQHGRRQDEKLLRNDVHDINLLTVIASQSYEDFARDLQKEIVDDLASRPHQVTEKLLTGCTLELCDKVSAAGIKLPSKCEPIFNALGIIENEHELNTDETSLVLDLPQAKALHKSLCNDLGYVDKKGFLTKHYYDDKDKGRIEAELLSHWVPALSSGYKPSDDSPQAQAVWDETKDLVQAEPWRACAGSVAELLSSVYSPDFIDRHIRLHDGRKELRVAPDIKKLKDPIFRNMWQGLSFRSTYHVDFDSAELIAKAVKKLDEELVVAPLQYEVTSGAMESMSSRAQLQAGTAFGKKKVKTLQAANQLSNHVTYDLVGNIVNDTALTRHDLIEILRRIQPDTFAKFQQNPEEFMKKAAKLINEAKAQAIVDHISYSLRPVEAKFHDSEVFVSNNIQDCSPQRVLEVTKGLYKHLVVDSEVERQFAQGLEEHQEVALYVKLPSSFYINTPVGKYTPDWAIAFYDHGKKLRHLCFVAETKGSMERAALNANELAKINCAKKHFEAVNAELLKQQLAQGTLSEDSIQRDFCIGFEVVDSVDNLFNVNFASKR